VPAAQPGLAFQPSALFIAPATRAVLGKDRPLVLALLATCVFWLVSGIAILAVNSLGLSQLNIGDFRTSIMTAVIGLGIAVGAVVAGKMCRGQADFRIVRLGLWGLVTWLTVISISLPNGQHLLGFWGCLPVLVLLGMSAGFFAIPVQVFIQSRPPEGQKGRMIAVMNLFNFIAILLAGPVYKLLDRLVVMLQWPRSPIFLMMALLVLPLAIGYRPKNSG
jgi:acyl-[acyl-carrier-protein]-phospholipid O-acyltransferase/long-chain-fatty-acid--[acyl-carrier-protein] ligase